MSSFVLNNREISWVVWLLIFFIFAFSIKEFRKSLPALVKAFFQYQIIFLFCLLSAYVSFVIYDKRNYTTLICKAQDTIDTKSNPDFKNTINGCIYKSYEQALPLLAKSLGATLTCQKKEQKFIIDDREETRKVQIHTISWNKEHYRAFAIAPEPVVEPPSFEAGFEKMFQEQKLCDMMLVSKDQKKIGVHAAILFQRAGDMIQALLTSQMKETQTRKIDFSEFDADVVKAFATFTYIGAARFLNAFGKKPSCDHFELFRFAQTYQIEPLISCVANIITLLDPEEHKELIASFAELYQTPQLVKLHEHLQKKPEPQVLATKEEVVEAHTVETAEPAQLEASFIPPCPRMEEVD